MISSNQEQPCILNQKFRFLQINFLQPKVCYLTPRTTINHARSEFHFNKNFWVIHLSTATILNPQNSNVIQEPIKIQSSTNKFLGFSIAKFRNHKNIWGGEVRLGCRKRKQIGSHKTKRDIIRQIQRTKNRI